MADVRTLGFNERVFLRLGDFAALRYTNFKSISITFAWIVYFKRKAAKSPRRKKNKSQGFDAARTPGELWMRDEFAQKILDAHRRSFKRAFETAVRTGTALVVMREGKLVKVKPPFKYELVPIKPAKKKKSRKK